MNTWEGKNISEEEATRVLKAVNSQVISEWSMQKLMDNITIDGDYWDIRLSKVSAKDLNKHDKRFFTDGDNNGKSLRILRNEVN